MLIDLFRIEFTIILFYGVIVTALKAIATL